MSIRVGINGFGRIGRNFYRAARAKGADLDVVAVNDLGSIAVLAHLLGHDSVHGRLDASVSVDDGVISVGDDELKVLSERAPENLPWGDLGVDVVVEVHGHVHRSQCRCPPLGRRGSAGWWCRRRRRVPTRLSWWA